MRILLLGARGFVGRHIRATLNAAGHTVVAGVSSSPGPGELLVDLTRDTTPASWLPRLMDIDAVVNAVGVLRDTRRRPMSNVHLIAPMALFAACAQVRVLRVVHVSALGIDGGTTDYARTKLAAERQLLERSERGELDGVVLRPSVVYGPGGASAQMFDVMSMLPVLPRPAQALATRIQPVHARDLAEGVLRLIDNPSPRFGMINATGPRAMTLAEFIGELRAQRGRLPARTRRLPDRLMRLSARLGDALPITPWGRQTLALLSTDNTADAAPFTSLLGREPLDPSRFNAAPMFSPPAPAAA
jgi:nucleoside-diphosphate-sugar epimerase